MCRASVRGLNASKGPVRIARAGPFVLSVELFYEQVLPFAGTFPSRKYASTVDVTHALSP